MKKEEILEASKKENKKKDVYEIEIDSRAGQYAAISMLLLAFIFFTYEIASGKGSNPAFYSLITLFNTVVYGYKAIKLSNHRKLNAFTSITWGLLTIILLLEYFNVIF